MTDRKAADTPASAQGAARSEPLLPSVSTGAPQVTDETLASFLHQAEHQDDTVFASIIRELQSRRAAPSPAGVGENGTPHPAVMRDYIVRLAEFAQGGWDGGARDNAGFLLADEARGYIGALACSSEPLSAGEGESGGIDEE